MIAQITLLFATDETYQKLFIKSFIILLIFLVSILYEFIKQRLGRL